MSIETWIESSVLLLAFLLLSMAGLVDASLVKRQRLTIRELLENGANGGHTDHSNDQSGELRSAVDVAMLVAVLVIGAAISHVTFRVLSAAWMLAILPATMLIILAAGRAIPSALVDRFSLADAHFVQRMALAISSLMGPLIMVSQAASALMDRASVSSPDVDSILTADEQQQRNESADADAVERGEIQHDEHEMISGILSMENAFAREIMVPRPDVVAVAHDTSISEIVRVAEEAGHSRIPVYQETIDQICGIVYAKDLLRFVDDDVSTAELDDLMRPAMYVPESKRVDDLLRDLQRARVHMAIVVDEYGGTAGLVTIEDIIEEIVGEIQDEYDHEVPLFEYGADGEVTVDGRMSVDELSELIGTQLPETESETVGGLVARELGHIPEPGEVVRSGPIDIQVKAVERRRVKTVVISIAEDPVAYEVIDPVRAS